MNGSEMAAIIGRIGTLAVKGGWRVPVEVTDAKQAYGCLRYRVRPLPHDGAVAQWVDANRVTLEEMTP